MRPSSGGLTPSWTPTRPITCGLLLRPSSGVCAMLCYQCMHWSPLFWTDDSLHSLFLKEEDGRPIAVCLVIGVLLILCPLAEALLFAKASCGITLVRCVSFSCFCCQFDLGLSFSAAYRCGLFASFPVGCLVCLCLCLCLLQPSAGAQPLARLHIWLHYMTMSMAMQMAVQMAMQATRQMAKQMAVQSAM